MEVRITIYDKLEQVTTTMTVEQTAENRFKIIENDIFNCELTFGTEFETELNSQGLHEIKRIIKRSGFTTRRFFLSLDYKISDYRMLGDELVKRGGFWQVDFGGYLTVNIPPDFEFDIDTLIQELNLNVIEVG